MYNSIKRLNQLKILNNVELRYLEHYIDLKYYGYVKVICKSRPLIFLSILLSISCMLGYLEVFKHSHLVLDNEV